MSEQKLVRCLSWLIAGILVLLPFHALLTTWAASNFGHFDWWRIWKDLLIAAMAVPAAWLAWRQPKLRQWLATSWITKLIGLYFILYLLMAGWALIHQQANGQAVIYSLIINLRFFSFFLVCLLVATYSDWLKRNYTWLLLGPAAGVILFGLVQKLLLPLDWLRHLGYGQQTIPAYQTVDANIDFRRLQSTMRGANPLGAYLTIIIPALISARVTILQNFKHLKWLMLALGLIVLYFTYSRSAWLGVALAVGLTIWWSVKQKKRGWRLIGLGMAGVFTAGGLLLVNNSAYFEKTFLHTNQTSTASQSSNSKRLKALKAASLEVINQPLGRGTGTAGPASVRNDGHHPRIAENYYLQIGQEVGILGVALFIAINILLARHLWRQRRDALSKVLLASLAGISLINLLSHAWTDDSLSLIWWGLAGVAIGSTLLNNKLKLNKRNST